MDDLDILDIVTEEQTIRREVSLRTEHIVTESYLFNGVLSCESGPALREFDEVSGRLKREVWMLEGKADRWGVDKPCETVWDVEHNVIVHESYMQLGNYHREHHRPARIWYSPETGNIVREEFWKDNQLHRDNNLPAVIEYNPDDYKEVTKQEFYHHGARINAAVPSPKP